MAKILVVDDSETLRVQLKGLLGGAGHEVLEAEDGEKGLQALGGSGNGIQLVICDVNMPVMDGLTMCTKVSESSAINSIPIFMLTTEANPDMKDRGKKAGVKAWISKPFDDQKLLTAISKVCG